jgi:restriction endonuclease S subunit
MKKVEVRIPVDENGDYDLQSQQRLATVFTFMNEMRGELQQWHRELDDCIISAALDGYTMRGYPLKDILAPIKGKSIYTKKYGESNKGDYPVYSASSNRPLTHIDTYDFCGTYLSWATNGFAGTVSILTDRFSINGDRGILLPKREDVDIQYLRYILQPLFRRLAKGRVGDRGADEFTKLYPSMIADVQVPLPVDENGEISLMEQQEIAAIYATIEQYKREVLERLNTLITQKVEL